MDTARFFCLEQAQPSPVSEHTGHKLKSLFGADIAPNTQWLIAIAVILCLLVILWLFLHSFANGKLRIKGQGNTRNRQPRLGVVDMFDLDRQRQLVLIRRDNVEHLILIGGSSDVVVESHIIRSGIRAPAPQPATEIMQDFLPENIMPAAKASTREPAQISVQIPSPQIVETKPADAAVPVTVQATVAAALATQAISSLSAQQAAKPVSPPAPASVQTSAPAQTPVMPIAPKFSPLTDNSSKPTEGQIDDMSRQLEEALKRPFAAVRPSQAANQEAPSQPAAKPVVKDEEKPAAPVQMQVPPPIAPKAELKPDQKPAITPQAKPAAPVTALPAPVAEQLAPKQADLSPQPIMPKAVATPAAAAVPMAQAPAAKHATASDDFDLEKALAQALEVPAAEPPKTQPMQSSAPSAAAAPSLAPAKPLWPAAPETAMPAPVAAEAPAAARQAETRPVTAALASAVAAPVAAAASAAIAVPEKKAEEPTLGKAEADPFSLDSIESEFARLLGRDPAPPAKS